MFADDSSALVKGKNNIEVNAKTIAVNDSVINFDNENFLRIETYKHYVTFEYFNGNHLIRFELSAPGTPCPLYVITKLFHGQCKYHFYAVEKQRICYAPL
jgi:hypothetical protein